MQRRARITGLVFFIALVAAVQVVEHTYRWYVHREDRVRLPLLREELIDAGAEMIRAQLAIDRLREELRSLEDRGADFVVFAGRGPRSPAPGVVVASPALHRPGAVRAAARNRGFTELNDAVSRRNSAALRYHLLADSIRVVAVRARDPYFAVPLPAEAATARGVEPGGRVASGPSAAARHTPTGQRSLLHGATPRLPNPE